MRQCLAPTPELVRGPPVNKPLPNSFRHGPDEHGRFGQFGGRFVAETLMPLILELEQAYEAAKTDPAFQAELRRPATSIMSAAPARSISPSA